MYIWNQRTSHFEQFYTDGHKAPMVSRFHASIRLVSLVQLAEKWKLGGGRGGGGGGRETETDGDRV